MMACFVMWNGRHHVQDEELSVATRRRMSLTDEMRLVKSRKCRKSRREEDA